jgi:hypothetical protein
MASILHFSVARIAAIVMVVAGLAACANTSPPSDAKHDTVAALPPTPAGTPRDFDFEHGRWHTSLRRLVKPLSGSQEWAEYTGTTTVHPLMGGQANIVDLDVKGPHGRIEGVSLRLFDTQRKLWTLNFSNAAGGTLELPMSGGFGGGRHGVFYSHETFRGRPILVRFVIDVVDADTARFEQAFSADAGASWEVNWVAVDKRVR